jgi:putative membrane protein
VKAHAGNTARGAACDQSQRRQQVDAQNEGEVMRNVQWMSTGLCAGLLFSADPSFAEGATPQTTQASAAAPTDGAFVARALGVNQAEIMLGQMAIKRGTTLEVRAMGDKMVRRHSELALQLRELAPASGPPTLSVDQQRTIARLAAVSEYEFDRSFKNTVGAGHVEELAMYREEVSHAGDPRLRALAKGRVTALEQSMASVNPVPSVPPMRRGW